MDWVPWPFRNHNNNGHTNNNYSPDQDRYRGSSQAGGFTRGDSVSSLERISEEEQHTQSLTLAIGETTENGDIHIDDQHMMMNANIQRPGGSFRVVRRPGEYVPSKDEREKVEKRLPEDTFSLVMIAPYRSYAFFFGALVSFFQCATYVLVLVDVTDITNSVNPFDFPPNVDFPVRAAEVIALIILVPLQDEILEAMILINDGYQKDALEAKFSGTSKRKYVLSLLCRIVVGILSIVSSFLLIMKESEVLEIFFNFIALQFINDLDNLAFRLATEGLVGSSVQSAAVEVSDTSYFTQRKFRRRLPLVFVFLAILGGWIWIAVLQQRGHFVSESIEVQFGDDLDPALATFSGIFERQKKPASNSGRFHYVNRQTGSALFGYCPEIEAWTFTYRQTGNPCDFVLKSSKTESYEITDAVLWGVGIGLSTETIVPLSPFYMACFRCADRDNPCSNGGKLVKGECQCADDFSGRRCQNRFPCERIALDNSGENFRGPRDMPLEYEVLRTTTTGEVVKLYDKPVYVDPVQDRVILFNGRRWGMTSAQAMNVSSVADLPAALENGWQLYERPVDYAFLSDPSDVGTLTDTVAPLDFKWFRASDPSPQAAEHVQRPLVNEVINAVFGCATCHATAYPCNFGNPCVNGTCVCIDGSTGVLCQLEPLGNGHCDTAFNTWDFNFDGGDCCQASCLSSEHYFCGYEGRIETGYSQCVDDSYSLCDPDETCWIHRAAELKLKRVRSGVQNRRMALELSPNGRVAVIGYPRVSTIQVYDQVDSEWMQRGDDIYGEEDSLFGHAVAMSTPQANILDFISEPLSIRLAVGAMDVSPTLGVTYSVQVLEWKNHHFAPMGAPIQFQHPEVVFVDNQFDFFETGRYLAVQTRAQVVDIFELEDGNDDDGNNNNSNHTNVASFSCIDLGIVCKMGSLQSVAEGGSFLLQSTASRVFHIVNSADDLATANWTAQRVATNVEWAKLSRNGLVVATYAQSRFQFFTWQETTNAWVRLGNDLLVDDQKWAFMDEVTALSFDGLTASFGFSSVSNNGETKKVEVFRYEAPQWSRFGANELVAGENPVISSSHDSAILVVADEFGDMRTYNYAPYCRLGEESHHRLFITLVKYQRLTWSLKQLEADGTTSSLTTSPNEYYPTRSNRKILHQVCLPRAQCTVLEITTFPGVMATFNESVVSWIVDDEEIWNIVPANVSHTIGDCNI